MSKPCQDISIPTVDNTELACDEFVNSLCIKVLSLDSNIRTYYGLGTEPTLNEVLTALATSLIDARDRIATLEP